MPITVIVRTGAESDTRLTFDGIQSIVVGRGSSCDVRLPDASVSHRHAVLRMQNGELQVVDEGSTNGTFVGDVRVASRTSRVLRSGESIRLGRLWIEVRVDASPVTRDTALATRNLALALIAASLDAQGRGSLPEVHVVEGPDQGAILRLEEEGRPYIVGRGAECELPLADADASREHTQIFRNGAAVVLRDCGSKNGTWLGESRLPPHAEAVWRVTQMVRIGRTVVALREPVGDALAAVEQGPDESLDPDEPVAPAPAPHPPPSSSIAPAPANLVSVQPLPPPVVATRSPSAKRGRWSIVDLTVMAAALAVLALSLAGLLWLLRG